MRLTIYRLRRADNDRVIGYAIPFRRWAIVLLYGAKPRGLWLFKRVWLEATPTHEPDVG